MSKRMSPKWLSFLTILLVTTFAAGVGYAQSGGGFDLSWNTIDGGGGMFSTGATYNLGGTIGQPDAGRNTGGTYTLDGGFWGAAASLPSPTATSTSTSTPTATATGTKTATATNTVTSTATSTSTSTRTSTSTSTRTVTSTSTSIASSTNTATNTATSTSTRTNTAVPTNTQTNTAIPTATATAPSTGTSTAVATPTPGNTDTPTGTGSSTPASTTTPAGTGQPTDTSTATPTSTSVGTYTSSPTHTSTATTTATTSATATASGTTSATIVPATTVVPSATTSPTDVPQTSTATLTGRTASPTDTATLVVTFTPTGTVAITSTTSTPYTSTSTSTSTATLILVGTVTPTVERSPTMCPAGWTIVSSPNQPPADNELLGISADATNDVWSVGFDTGGPRSGHQTLIEHWDGTQWSLVPHPTPGDYEVLYAVQALSPTNVWAVGYYTTNDNPRTLIEHWDGTQWSVVSSPNMPGSYEEYLYAISAVSANDIWTVGQYVLGTAQSTFPLIQHWDGVQWSIVPSASPNVPASLHGVSAVSASDVWAVGYNLAATLTVIEHWDGTQWSAVSSPNDLTYNRLNSVDAVSADDIWAVGSSFTNAYQTLIEHWNGTQWSVVPSPNHSPGNNLLLGLAAVSPNDAWAVGQYGDHGGLVEHWNGASWSIVPGPDPGQLVYGLNSVAAVSAGNLWAAGYQFTGTGETATLVEHYAGDCSLSTPTPTACSIQFSDVPAGSTFYPYIQCLACRGVVSGYPNGTFHPNSQITRGQISKMVSIAAGFSEDPGPQIYDDVSASNTFYPYINRLTLRGIMSGYPCPLNPDDVCVPGDQRYFRPGLNATRGQISKIVSNAAGFSDDPVGQSYADVTSTNTFYVWVMRLTSRGVMSGYACGGPGEPCDQANRPYFRPFNDVTRGQTAKIVSNTFFPGCNTLAKR